jgi:hypothetical protein
MQPRRLDFRLRLYGRETGRKVRPLIVGVDYYTSAGHDNQSRTDIYRGTIPISRGRDG